MKLSRAELISIIITVIFVAAAATVTLLTGGTNASVTVSMQETEAPVSSAPAPSFAPSELSPSPSMAESTSPTSSVATTSKSNPQSPVNINTATSEKLCTLPGIGAKTAEKIISYRQTHGLFKKTSEIMNVSGIGSAKYAAIKNFITVQEGDDK